jgi:iron complex outermembrane receptor protein/hemoglobin/transferrin/lactoferrin receptor protein
LAIFNVINAVTGEAEVENGQGVVETQHISRANRVFGQGGVTFEPTTAWYVTFQTRWSMAYKEPAPGDATDVRHTTFGYADGGMPGYAVLDLKAGYRWNKAIRLDGALENLLNHSYREVGSGIDGAGLSGVVRVTARY